MVERDYYLGATPEDAARIVRDRAVPGHLGEREVQVFARRAGLPQGTAVGIRVDEGHVRALGRGRYAVDVDVALAGVTRAYQPWHVDVEGNASERWRGYLREDARGLRNFLDVETYDELRGHEDNIVEARIMELAVRPVPQTHDLDHLRALHGRLFQDVYPWAGEARTVNMGRPGGPGFTPWDEVQDAWRDLAPQAKAVQQVARLPGVSREDFADGAALVYNTVNTAHAFREGNGRTQRQWMDDLARPAGYQFRWTQVSSHLNDRVSQLAREGDPGPMQDMFRRITERAPGVQKAGESSSAGVEAARLAQVSYGTSATQATAPTRSTSTPPGVPIRPQPPALGDRGPGLGG